VHRGRILIKFPSVVDATLPYQGSAPHRRAHRRLPAERRIVFRIGIHLGVVVEEADRDLISEGANRAARRAEQARAAGRPMLPTAAEAFYL
jgi:adenylate cyclase